MCLTLLVAYKGVARGLPGIATTSVDTGSCSRESLRDIPGTKQRGVSTCADGNELGVTDCLVSLVDQYVNGLLCLCVSCHD